MVLLIIMWYGIFICFVSFSVVMCKIVFLMVLSFLGKWFKYGLMVVFKWFVLWVILWSNVWK